MPDTTMWIQLKTSACAAATACGLSFMLTPLVRRIAVRWGLSSKPVEERWGKRVVARLGGVAMSASFVIAALIWVPFNTVVLPVMCGIGAVFVLGLIDDLRRLPPYVKLVAQLLIGCGLVAGGVQIELVRLHWIAVPLSVLWFVLIMNAFNLLDNMDGLAGGVGAIASAFCAVHAAIAGQWMIVMLNATLCGACLGFLRYNVPPAKIYMGDSGSHFLGLCLAMFSLLGTWRHSTQLISVLAVPVLVLAVPIFDTIFVTIQRLLNRQHLFVGGTDHVSHRLAVLGLSERQTLVALYCVSIGLGLLSIVSVELTPLSSVAVWIFVLTGLVLFGRYLAQVKVYRAQDAIGLDLGKVQGERKTVINTMLLHKRRLLEILVDFLLICGAYVTAYLLRFEGVLTGDLQQLIMQSLPIILVVKLACFACTGLYRGVWRYVGLSDLVLLLRSVGMSSVISACVLLYVWRFQGYSRAVIVIDGMLTFFAIGGARIAERIFDDWINRLTARGVPVLIMGAGDTGARVLRSLKYEDHIGRRGVCFLDDDTQKHGVRIHGCSVVGTRAALEQTLDDRGIHEVLIAIADPPGELLQHIQHCCEPRSVRWKVVTAGVTDAL
jgi:UDP-GlcNAc:undecaprenyl-phosphate/decaprenyl-phosphate GlcNAc-1-phosphate transferase